MLRGLLILLFVGASALVTLPFLMSSLYIDQRGVTIPGHVYSKREDAIIQYSTWYRSCEVTFEYWGPEESGVSFLKVELRRISTTASPRGSRCSCTICAGRMFRRCRSSNHSVRWGCCQKRGSRDSGCSRDSS